MRKVRYRAWDKEVEKMFPVLEIDFVEGWVRMYSKIAGRHYNWLDNLVLMQYTGLEDKYGEEICDGDILTWENNIIAKVYYADDMAMFRCVIEGTEEFDLFVSNQEASIIGNIYENKELLDE
ncbi:YopX family protein [Campylobacter concisus]|uniref:YopX family protein n=1 Tax=Campylobacter concisus TaxID=199 RepID=UPI000A05B4C9|nr:YopX family protein [Campylobacter concisus]ORI00225.1 hypothetical protein A3223_07410 [Campylobacter concisus]